MKRLYKSRTNRKVSGVCGGLAEYFGIDATIIRLVWAILVFAFGTGLLAYIIAAIVMSDEPEEVHREHDKADYYADGYRAGFEDRCRREAREEAEKKDEQ